METGPVLTDSRQADLEPVEVAPSGDGQPLQNKKRGPYARSQVTKQAFLESALEVFAQSGYASGTISEIAERAGVSSSSLVHHFGGKQGLFLALLEHLDAQTMTELDWENLKGREVLHGALKFLDFSASTPHLAALYGLLAAEAADADHPAHRYMVDRETNTRANFVNAFRDIAVEEGLRSGIDPATAGATTVALLEGLQVQWLLEPQVIDRSAVLRCYFNAVLTAEL